MTNPDEEMVTVLDGELVPRSELWARTSVLAPGIILTRDYARANAATWEVQAEATHAAGSKLDRYILILDLTEAKNRPKGTHKEAIFRTFDRLLRPDAVIFIQPGSALLRSALGFLLKPLAAKTMVKKTLEQAIVEAKRIRDEG